MPIYLTTYTMHDAFVAGKQVTRSYIQSQFYCSDPNVVLLNNAFDKVRPSFSGMKASFYQMAL